MSVKKIINNSIICIISSDDNKVTIAIGVTSDITDDYDSVELVNIVSRSHEG